MISMPVTLTLGGLDGRTVVMTSDRTGEEEEFTPEQARALAADLEAMADEAES